MLCKKCLCQVGCVEIKQTVVVDVIDDQLHDAAVLSRGPESDGGNVIHNRGQVD